MMPGDWLTRVTRRLLHDDTFELVVSPAIADLQFESHAMAAPPLRSYLAVWIALAGALLLDLDHDVRDVIDEGTTFATLALVQSSYYLAMLTLVFDGMSRSASLTLALCVIGASTMSTTALFWPDRRRHA
jgi:hypothetical protein